MEKTHAQEVSLPAIGLPEMHIGRGNPRKSEDLDPDWASPADWPNRFKVWPVESCGAFEVQRFIRQHERPNGRWTLCLTPY